MLQIFKIWLLAIFSFIVPLSQIHGSGFFKKKKARNHVSINALSQNDIDELCELFEVDSTSLVVKCRELKNEMEILKETVETLREDISDQKRRSKKEQELISEFKQQAREKIKLELQESQEVHDALLKSASEQAKGIVEIATQEARRIREDSLAEADERIRQSKLKIAELEESIRALQSRFTIHPMFKKMEKIGFCVDGQCVEIDKSALIERFSHSLLAGCLMEQFGQISHSSNGIPLGNCDLKNIITIKQAIENPKGVISDFDKLEPSERKSLDAVLDYLHIGRRGESLYDLNYIGIDSQNIRVIIKEKEMSLKEYWQLEGVNTFEIDDINLEISENFSNLLIINFREFFSYLIANAKQTLTKERKLLLIILALSASLEKGQESHITYLNTAGVDFENV